jgi:CRP/FNR family transcriptional regulator, cyclic AMP receptor protein
MEPTRWRLLSGLSPADRLRVLESARPCTFAAGETVFAAGEQGTSLHLIESGRVAIRIVTPDGEQATLTIAGPGDAIGEMALLRRSSIRSAAAIAWEPTRTLALERDAFRRLCQRHPDVQRLLIGVLAERVERLSVHLVEALYMSVDKRIVHRLLELCRVYQTPGARTVVVPLRQEDLAGLAGTTRPSVNTLLRRLEDEGTVALSRGRVEVLDTAALARAGQ